MITEIAWFQAWSLGHITLEYRTASIENQHSSNIKSGKGSLGMYSTFLGNAADLAAGFASGAKNEIVHALPWTGRRPATIQSFAFARVHVCVCLCICWSGLAWTAPARSHMHAQAGAPVVWLASYAHGQRRLTDTRTRCCLPSDAWFTERLNTAGLVPSRNSGQIELQGLAVLKPGTLQSTLAARSQEVELLWRYHGRPLDAYSYIVDKIFPCVEPLPLYVRRRVGRGGNNVGGGLDVPIRVTGCGFFWPSGCFDDVQLHPPGTEDHGFEQRAAAVCEKLFPEPQALDQIPCVLVVAPIAEFVCRRRWSHIVFLVLWGAPHFFHDWPPQRWAEQCAGQPWAPSAHDLRSDQLAKVAADLRRWAPLIAAGPPPA